MKTVFLTHIAKDLSYTVKAHESLEIIGAFDRGWAEKRAVRILCVGEHAHVNIVLATRAGRADAFPLEIITEQRANHSVVNIAMRSVVRDTANVFCNGMMSIGKGIRGAHASFSHHALLLSSFAQAKIIPSLEIHSDDVTAGHAVTVGKPEPEQILYLQTRGIDAAGATDLLAYGFALRDAQNIQDQGMRSRFISSIDQYAPTLA